MIEPEKKGSPWPWILVPLAAVSLFFVLRECRQILPAPDPAPAPAKTTPAPGTPAPADTRPAGPEKAPVTAPAPQ